MTTMTIRCNEEDKKAAQEVAEYYGFDLSSVTRAIWKQMARTKQIPLDFGYEIPTAETLRAAEEGEKILAQGGTGQSFTSGADLIEAALG